MTPPSVGLADRRLRIADVRPRRRPRSVVLVRRGFHPWRPVLARPWSVLERRGRRHRAGHRELRRLLAPLAIAPLYRLPPVDRDRAVLEERLRLGQPPRHPQP